MARLLNDSFSYLSLASDWAQLIGPRDLGKVFKLVMFRTLLI